MPDSSQAGKQTEREVSGHDDEGRPEQHPFAAEQSVGKPSTEDGREVDRAAIGADDSGRHRLGQAKPAIGCRVVQVEQQNALHAVEAEPLPHFNAKDVGQGTGLPEEAVGLIPVRNSRGCVDSIVKCHAPMLCEGAPPLERGGMPSRKVGSK